MVSDWSALPLVLDAHDIAGLYRLHAKTVRAKAAAGDPGLPAPALDRPWRWRREDVRRHFETVTVDGIRRARRQAA